MIFLQINVGGDNNLAYVIGDEASHEAAIVDPSYDPKLVLGEAAKLHLNVKYLINTHSHYDHIGGNDYILQHTSAKFVDTLKDGDELKLGNLTLKIIATPGHTEDSICILVENKLLTGDTLFVGDVGRTWSEEGTRQEYLSLQKIFQLPVETEVYPGHDYGAKPSSTLGYEKKHNTCIKDILADDFAKFCVDK